MSSRGVISDDPVLIISSDGHTGAEMEGYRPYIPSELLEEFDAFSVVFKERGFRPPDPRNLRVRLDEESVDQWIRDVVEPGRLNGYSDAAVRFAELDGQGIAGEVVFPEFGLPFQLLPPLAAAQAGHLRTPEHVDVAARAYNRWLVDFVSADPTRIAGMAMATFTDVEETIAEITWARNAGLKGVVLPFFTEERPIYHPDFEPIWSALEDLDMPANSHISLSSAWYPQTPWVPFEQVAAPLSGGPIVYACRQLLTHLIWGGVLERHPKLKAVFTEQGSAWVVGELQAMDYSFEGSFLRRDVRDVIKLKPSEYFARQCFLGSSTFSRAEVQMRDLIGVDKMALGTDFPHHEGTWGAGPGTFEYLRATLGAAGVDVNDARRMLGQNAAELWGFDTGALKPLVQRIGHPMNSILQAPDVDYFPRGDVHKPAGSMACPGL